MNHKKSFKYSSLLCFIALASSFTTARAESSRWVSLFDGKSTEHWRRSLESGVVKIVDDEIHLSTKGKKWFLISRREYKNFIFEAEVRMPKGEANSGFIFRGSVDENGRVKGYQAEVDTSPRKWSGGLYEEGRRFWFISPNRDQAKSVQEKNDSIAVFRARAGDAYKANAWNHYKIFCKDDHIQIFVNGTLTTDIKDSASSKGILGLQHHGELGQTYRFRNIRLMELD